MISLYPPKSVPTIPADLMQCHWATAAVKAETMLRSFLALGDSEEVLLVDRATHGLELCLYDLYEVQGFYDVKVPVRTYRAVWDAAEDSGRVWPLDTIKPRPDRSAIIVPTTLGGLSIQDVWPQKRGRRRDCPVVVDAAHSFYPNMLEGYDLGPREFVVLSFYPTKPGGAFGGGAVIGHREAITRMRPRAWPSRCSLVERCRMYYPQTIQSVGIQLAVQFYDADYQNCLSAMWKQSAAATMQKFPGLNFAWSDKVPVSPHLLAFAGPERTVGALRSVCEEAGIETGDHYPPLMMEAGRPHITVPFWSPDYVDFIESLAVHS